MKNHLMRFNVALQTWIHGGGRIIQSKANGKLYKVKCLRFEPKLILVAYDEEIEIEREPEHFLFPALCDNVNSESCAIPLKSCFNSTLMSAKKKRQELLKKHRVFRGIKKIRRRLIKGF